MDIKIDIELEYRWSCFSCTGNQIILDIYSNWTFSATLTPLFLFKKVVSVPEKSKYYSGQKNAISNAIISILALFNILYLAWSLKIYMFVRVCVWGFFLGGGWLWNQHLEETGWTHVVATWSSTMTLNQKITDWGADG